MCTVVVHVPERAGAPVRVLAVRDEDPTRAWDPLGPWWPDAHPGVVGVRDRRAGGAWLAADAGAGRLAVILNRAEVVALPEAELGSRGHVVLDAVAGRGVADDPRTHGFNLVVADAEGVRVTMWDGAEVRTVPLPAGVHMVAHDDVDDSATARIIAWRDAFGEPSDDEPDAGDGERWFDGWLETLARSAELGPHDDRAIIRDNTPYGYPTQSLLVCAASVADGTVDVVYGELDEPAVWNPLQLG